MNRLAAMDFRRTVSAASQLVSCVYTVYDAGCGLASPDNGPAVVYSICWAFLVLLTTPRSPVSCSPAPTSINGLFLHIVLVVSTSRVILKSLLSLDTCVKCVPLLVLVHSFRPIKPADIVWLRAVRLYIPVWFAILCAATKADLSVVALFAHLMVTDPTHTCNIPEMCTYFEAYMQETSWLITQALFRNEKSESAEAFLAAATKKGFARSALCVAYDCPSLDALNPAGIEGSVSTEFERHVLEGKVPRIFIARTKTFPLFKFVHQSQELIIGENPGHILERRRIMTSRERALAKSWDRVNACMAAMRGSPSFRRIPVDVLVGLFWNLMTADDQALA